MTHDGTATPAPQLSPARLLLLSHLRELLEGFANGTVPADDGPRGKDHARFSASWVANDVDVGALSAWTLVGLRLFSGETLPDMRAFTKAARWVLLFTATERFDGNISRMAAALGTSRRAIREHLKAAGLYAGPTS